MDRFVIKSIALANIGPFDQLELAFRPDPGITLICGDNGIGKTTILESIAGPFVGGMPLRLRKKAGSDSGLLSLSAQAGTVLLNAADRINAFEPDATVWLHSLSAYGRNVINVRASRDFTYQRRDTITRDPKIDENAVSQRVGSGLDANEIKQWFSNRYLLRPHSTDGGWTDVMVRNLESSIRFFSVLDSSVSLKGVNVRTFDIDVNTPSGVVPFEYLSSGFRSAYVLLLGIMKEIEYRGLDVASDDYAGVILIDELDLHLHPTWQRRIAQVMTQAFPNAQILATTHSPHIIQAADATEVVALGRTEDGLVFERTLPSATYGYSGWTLDEVLEDVMGVPDTKSPEYRAAVAIFDRAVADENATETAKALATLRDMLHPGNPYRKLLELQAAPVLGNHE
jgi:hypothetical protein